MSFRLGQHVDHASLILNKYVCTPEQDQDRTLGCPDHAGTGTDLAADERAGHRTWAAQNFNCNFPSRLTVSAISASSAASSGAIYVAENRK